MLEFGNIEAFVQAAELGSFSAAARRMGKAQSAVSTTIANLEIDAGFELFDRCGQFILVPQTRFNLEIFRPPS